MKAFGWLNAEYPDNAVDHIRIKQPLNELHRALGWTISYDIRPGYALQEYEVIIGGRVALPEAAGPWTKACGILDGPFMIFETDDDYLGMNRWNPAQKALSDPQTRFGYKASARVSHRIVTSTNYLAQLLYEQMGHPDIVVVRNAVPGWMLDIPKPNNEVSLIIGWAGGTSHQGDWEWCREGIRKAMVRLPNATFRFVGADYRDLLRAPRMDWRPWEGSVEAYWRSRNLNLDIAVAPLRPESFNRSKSPIKLNEYAARGIPVVASRYGTYAEFVRDGETGILVKDKKEWTNAILELANDADLRSQMGAQARLQARNHTVEARIDEYREAYTP